MPRNCRRIKHYFSKSTMSPKANRGIAWTKEEVNALLDTWAEHDIQDQLAGRLHNLCVYDKISRRLRDLGYDRTGEQCREKVKKLRRDYRNAVESAFAPAPARRLVGVYDKVNAVFGKEGDSRDLENAEESATESSPEADVEAAAEIDLSTSVSSPLTPPAALTSTSSPVLSSAALILVNSPAFPSAASNSVDSRISSSAALTTNYSDYSPVSSLAKLTSDSSPMSSSAASSLINSIFSSAPSTLVNSPISSPPSEDTNSSAVKSVSETTEKSDKSGNENNCTDALSTNSGLFKHLPRGKYFLSDVYLDYQRGWTRELNQARKRYLWMDHQRQKTPQKELELFKSLLGLISKRKSQKYNPKKTVTDD